ncbi:MAG TPA: TolC family protein [Bacteroidales bacterium]|nr:TolC family protein [Bacteroidales bacterium]
MKYNILLSLFLLFALRAVEAQQMDLNQCIRYALDNNLAITNKNLEESLNNELYMQTKRNFLPQIYGGSSANKQYGRSIDPTTNSFVNHDFFSMNFYVDTQLELFRGFSRINSMKFQKLNLLIGLEESKQKKMEIAFEVMNHYYDLLYFTRLHEIVQEQLRLTILNTEKIKTMIGLGLKSESDLLEMKAQQATETHNLLLAENQYDLAAISLKSLMNWPLSKELNPVDESMENTIAIQPSADRVYEAALLHMPSVWKAELDVEAAAKQLAIAKGNLAPTLTLGGGIYTNFADSRKEESHNGLAEQTIPFMEQWSQNLAQSVYLNLQIPIFNRWYGNSQLKQAKWRKTMAENRQEEEQQKLYRLVNEDVQQLNSLQKELDLLETKKEATQEAFLIAEKKLDQGLISIIEFYTAKNQLAQAETEWIRTLLQLKIKEKTIRIYLGEELF